MDAARASSCSSVGFEFESRFGRAREGVVFSKPKGRCILVRPSALGNNTPNHWGGNTKLAGSIRARRRTQQRGPLDAGADGVHRHDLGERGWLSKGIDIPFRFVVKGTY